jgi:hypothetical protein
MPAKNDTPPPEETGTEETAAEETDAAAAAEEADAPPPAEEKIDGRTVEGKRAAFEMRQLQQRLEALEKENQGYKRRADEERRAKLSDEQRLREERDELAQRVEEFRIAALQQKIAAEFKLPPSMAVRLIGTDEEAIRADAEDLAKLLPKPRVGSATDPLRDAAKGRIYKRSELAADPKLAASPEVLQAAHEGRVVAG